MIKIIKIKRFFFFIVFGLFLLSIFNYITEKYFLLFYNWPNFSDDYIIGIIFFSFLLFLFNEKKIFLLSKFNFNNFDIFFLFTIAFYTFLETFIYNQNYNLIRDITSIFIVYKTLDLLNIEKKNDYIFYYLFLIFTFLTLSFFFIYFSFHYFKYELFFIDYTKIALSRYFFFDVAITSILCIYLKNELKILIVLYFFLFLVSKWSFNRADLICFIFLPILMIINLNIKDKLKYILLIIHIILVFIFFKTPIDKFIKSSIGEREFIQNNLDTTDYDALSKHGDIISNIARIQHLTRDFAKFKENIFFGSGFDVVENQNQNKIKGVCECSIFHPLFAYGIFGFSILIYLYYLLLKNMLIKKNINFFIQFNVVFLIYLSLFPHFPAWIGLGIYMVKDMSKKSL